MFDEVEVGDFIEFRDHFCSLGCEHGHYISGRFVQLDPRDQRNSRESIKRIIKSRTEKFESRP